MKESLTPMVLVHCAIIFIESNAYFKPSFVSKWYKMESQKENSQINIAHYLNETPIKVIADVKVKDTSIEYIFRGMGGPERDDDVDKLYGGVLVAYNQQYVELRSPKSNNQKLGTGHVIYTGSRGSWTGSENTRSYDSAMVRVRVWKLSDLPDPSFTSNWTYINTKTGLGMYNDIPHFMNSYPDLVNLQVKVRFKDELIFEGQGASSVLKQVPPYGSSSGAVFGYNNASVRVWFMKGADVFNTHDGWGRDPEGAKEGFFRIIAWKFKENETSTRVEHSFKDIVYLNGNLQLDNLIVNAQFQVRSGLHAGFRFYGIGSAMNDGGPYSKYGLCGGLVNAITKSYIRMWIPSSEKYGFTFNYGGGWGNRSFHQSTNDVSFRIQLIPWYDVGTTTPNSNNGVRCPVTGFKNERALTVITGNRQNDTVQHYCSQNYIHVGGDLTRTCQENGEWSGRYPECEEVKCATENLNASTATTLLNVTGSRYMSVATYICSEHHLQIGGDPYRYCQNDSTWSNLTLDCYQVNCSTENLNISTATTLLNVTGSRYMSVATYKCSEHHRQIGGDPYRYCQNDSTWSNLTLDCYRCRCRCLNETDNKLKDIMDQTKQQLTVKKQELSNFIRKRTSAKDERPTSKGIGAAGAVVLIVTVLIVVILDLPLLHQQLTTAWKNIRSRYQIKKRNQHDPKL